MRNLFISLGILAVFPLFGQNDALVSKGAGKLVSTGSMVWMFDKSSATENTSYSRLNLFADPPEVFTIRREGIPFGNILPLGTSVLAQKDSVESVEDALAVSSQFYRFSADDNESLEFTLEYLADTDLNLSVLLRDDAQNDSLLVLAFGNAGLLLLEKSSSGNSLSLEDTLAFYTLNSLPALEPALKCAVNDTCDLDTLAALQADNPLWFVDQVEMVQRGEEPVVYILAGEKAANADDDGPLQLLRWNLATQSLETLAAEGLGSLKLGEAVFHINPYNQHIWLFSESSFFISQDSGATFATPAGISEDILPRLKEPKMAFYEDRAFINFNFSGHPGVAEFLGDSLLPDFDQDEDSYQYVLDTSLANQLDPRGTLGELTVVESGGEALLVAGHRSQGIFYRNITDNGPWQNLVLQRSVKKGLQEVITFPTIYDGSRDVGLGYQLADRPGLDVTVTITVFNYAMEKVRDLVKNSPRKGGGNRSENPLEDKWDARDNSGNRVAAGMYYVLIEASTGERGWGKVMVTTGKWQ